MLGMANVATASHEALADFLARCDPASPAPAESYVPRPQPFAPWLGKTLSRVPTAKVLLMGQAGVGKSTELARLGESLGSGFTLLRPPLDQVLDLSIAGWHDIVVLAALWSGRSLARTALPSQFQFAVDTLERALIHDLTPPGAPKATGIQSFRNDHWSVHKRVELARAQFWDLALDVLKPKAFVLLLDGLEKLPNNATVRLFREERRFIIDLPLRTVVTAPLAMSFLQDFGEIESDFLAVTRLRALSHSPGEPGSYFLRDLAIKRGALNVMPEYLLDEMISWSGGLPRQMLHLLAAAATQALTEGLARIENESFARARRKVTERWQYQLEPQDYEALSKSDEDRTTSERSRLLSLGALLEYDQPDGGLGLGVNPLVGALLKQRKPSS